MSVGQLRVELQTAVQAAGDLVRASEFALRQKDEGWFDFGNDTLDQLRSAHRLAASVVGQQQRVLSGYLAMSDAELARVLDTVDTDPETGRPLAGKPIVLSLRALQAAASTLRTVVGEVEASTFGAYFRDTAAKVGQTIGNAAGTIVAGVGDALTGAAGSAAGAALSSPGGLLLAALALYLLWKRGAK